MWSRGPRVYVTSRTCRACEQATARVRQKRGTLPFRGFQPLRLDKGSGRVLHSLQPLRMSKGSRIAGRHYRKGGKAHATGPNPEGEAAPMTRYLAALVGAHFGAAFVILGVFVIGGAEVFGRVVA